MYWRYGQHNVISPHYRTLRERERGRKRENESKKEIITHIIRSVWTSVSICSLSIVVSIYMSCYKFTFYCGKKFCIIIRCTGYSRERRWSAAYMNYMQVQLYECLVSVVQYVGFKHAIKKLNIFYLNCL